jgi:hypothetical protein
MKGIRYRAKTPNARKYNKGGIRVPGKVSK